MTKDQKPDDPLIAPERPPARTLDGRIVEPSELEAAAELSRLARRIGLAKRGLDGFRLQATYRRSISALARVAGWGRRR